MRVGSTSDPWHQRASPLGLFDILQPQPWWLLLRDQPTDCAKLFSIHATIPNDSLRCLRRWDVNKTYPVKAPEWRKMRGKQLDALVFHPPLKILSPAVITPKIPHSPLTAPEDFPPLPYSLSGFVATCETAAGHSARMRGAAVLALTAFLFGFLHSGISSRVPAGFVRSAP